MSFKELYNAIFHISGYHGFELIRIHDWVWKFENKTKEIDVYFNKHIKKFNKFNTGNNTLLKVCKKNKKGNWETKWYRDLDLMKFETLLVELNKQ